jgi:protein-tyrosine phosphatase
MRAALVGGGRGKEMSVDWITETIAVGNYLEAQDAGLLREFGIQSALSLDGTLTQSRADELGLTRVATTILIDGAGNDLRFFSGAIESLIHLAQTQPPVLVQCHAGRSRSIAVIAGYLIKVNAIKPDEALRQIASKREFKLAAALEELLYKL